MDLHTLSVIWAAQYVYDLKQGTLRSGLLNLRVLVYIISRAACVCVMRDAVHCSVDLPDQFRALSQARPT